MRSVLVISMLLVFAAFAWGDTVTTAWEDTKAFKESIDVRAEVEELLAEFEIYDEAVIDAATSHVAQALAEGGSNAGDGDASADETLRYTMQRGDWIHVDRFGEDALTGSIKVDNDVYVFILYGPGQWYMEVIDCCIMGDTMLAVGKVAGVSVMGWATSPAIITLGPVPSPANFAFGVVIVGYLAAPGGYPAGYSVDVWY